MVVVSGNWMKITQYVNYVEMNAAKAVLISRPNSHPFHERTLTLDQPVKVGRSVARARATATNAIFDCKVLSRHHAVLWHDNGKFFLQDTKSSNGTFVNNNRLSSNESEPHEVSSGDIVQFGVDVVENNHKVIHGCIVATLKLYLPDGKEAKASPSIVEGVSHGVVPLDDLYKLNQIIQEASQREICLQTKLNALQHVVEAARRAADEGWQAYVGEERLLSRVATLETQLQQTVKSFGDDRMREELKQLQEDRTVYQLAAKEALLKSHADRLEAIAAAAEQERARVTAENEVLLVRENWEQAQQELQEMALKLATEQEKVEDERKKFEQKVNELQAQVEEYQENREKMQKQLGSVTSELNPNTDLDIDPHDAIMKFDRILNNVKLDEDNETSRFIFNSENINDNEKTQERDDIILSTVNKSDEPICHDSSIAFCADAKDGIESAVENKDDLITSKESMSDQSLSGSDIEEHLNAEINMEFAPSGDNMKTLKYQTVCEQKRLIEQLEILSSANRTRIALLEKSLLNEKDEKSYLASKADLFKEEHAVLEMKYIACLNENKELHARLAENAAVPRLSLVDCGIQSDLCGGYYKDQKNIDATLVNQEEHITKLNTQVHALEEEVVGLKERYAAVVDERMLLNKELINVHDKYNALSNRSHNTLFFYVAPLALMVLYLLVSSMFS